MSVHRSGAEIGVVALATTGLRRLCWIAWVLLRHAVAWALGPRLEGLPFLAARLPSGRLDRHQRLRVILEDIGGTFVKFGQMLALQPDIVPLATCNELFELLDRIEAFPYGKVEQIFQEETGRSLSETFDSIEEEPLATASVGQVHVAYLDGRKVALKVRRPNVEREFGSDIRLMMAFMGLLRLFRLRALYWLLEPMGEFVQWTEEELDFRYEARYQEELNRASEESRIQTVPAVYSALTSPRILVTEFLEGPTLLAYFRALETEDEEALRRLLPEGFERSRFAGNIIDNFLADAFGAGIYHADLHPANLMILPGNVVGYIDFGITGVISAHGRSHLVRMTMALAEGNMVAFSEAFLPVTSLGPNSDPEAFRSGLERLAEGWYEDYSPGQRGQVLRVGFTRIMGEMLTLSRHTGILPERDIVKYIRSAIAIDGLLSRFAPEIQLGSHLAEACGRVLGTRARAELLDPTRWLDWSRASLPWLEEGPRGLVRWLDDLARERSSGEPVAPSAAGADSLGRRLGVLQLAVAILMTLALLALGQDRSGLGWNLWTSQLSFLVVTCAFLFHHLLKLAR